MDSMAGSICAARKDSVKPVTGSSKVSYREKSVYKALEVAHITLMKASRCLMALC